MRVILVFLFAVIGIVTAHAQPRVQALEIYEAGLFEAKQTRIEDKSISTGQRYELTSLKLLKRTTAIEWKKGIAFGIRARIVADRQGTLKLKTVWKYPEPGMKAPGAASGQMSDTIVGEETVSRPFVAYWTVGSDYQRVLGEWQVEVWQDDRLLIRQSFFVR